MAPPVPATYGELADTALSVQTAERAAGNPDFWGFVFQGQRLRGPDLQRARVDRRLWRRHDRRPTSGAITVANRPRRTRARPGRQPGSGRSPGPRHAASSRRTRASPSSSATPCSCATGPTPGRCCKAEESPLQRQGRRRPAAQGRRRRPPQRDARRLAARGLAGIRRAPGGRSSLVALPDEPGRAEAARDRGLVRADDPGLYQGPRGAGREPVLRRPRQGAARVR